MDKTISPAKRAPKRKCEDVAKELGGEFDNIVHTAVVAAKPKSAKRQKGGAPKPEPVVEDAIEASIDRYFHDVAATKKQDPSTIGGIGIIRIIKLDMFKQICEAFIRTAMQSVFYPERDRIESEGDVASLSQEALERIRFTDSFRYLIVYVLSVLTINISEKIVSHAAAVVDMPVPEVNSHHVRYQNADVLKRLIGIIIRNKVAISYQVDDIPEKSVTQCAVCSIHLRTNAKHLMVMGAERLPICALTKDALESLTYLFTAVSTTFKNFRSMAAKRPDAGASLEANVPKMTEFLVKKMKGAIVNICTEFSSLMVTNVDSLCVRRHMKRFFPVYEDPDDYRNNIDNISI